jgi:hypothetical protein
MWERAAPGTPDSRDDRGRNRLTRLRQGSRLVANAVGSRTRSGALSAGPETASGTKRSDAVAVLAQQGAEPLVTRRGRINVDVGTARRSAYAESSGITPIEELPVQGQRGRRQKLSRCIRRPCFLEHSSASHQPRVRSTVGENVIEPGDDGVLVRRSEDRIERVGNHGHLVVTRVIRYHDGVEPAGRDERPKIGVGRLLFAGGRSRLAAPFVDDDHDQLERQRAHRNQLCRRCHARTVTQRAYFGSYGCGNVKTMIMALPRGQVADG